MAGPYPNDQSNPAGAIPVWITRGTVTATFSAGVLQYTPLGYQQITSLSSATSLTVPSGATLAVIAISGNSIRYRDDGTAPTASIGMPVNVGNTLEYSGNLSAIQLIQQAASATLDILYYKAT